MDKVFASSSKTSNNSKLLKFLGGKSKTRDVSSDAITEYFPLYGGDGTDNFEVNPDFMSYEPHESMVDGLNYTPEEKSKLSRNIMRFVDKGSKYELFNHSNEPNQVSMNGASQRPPSLLDPMSHLRSLPPQPQPQKSTDPQPAETPNPESPKTEISPSGTENTSEPSLIDTICDMDLSHLRDYIRYIARQSVVLRPLDKLADKFSDVPLAVNGIIGLELFTIMLISDCVAWMTRLICMPFVFMSTCIWSAATSTL